jgi:quercetin dioxygenase-like cupin family protein
MTDCLPHFPETTGPDVDGLKQHVMSKGTSLSWNLLSQDEVSCARWFSSAGTEFPVHTHSQREWLIIYAGSMILKRDGHEDQRLLPGMGVVIEPEVKHAGCFVEDCWYVGITVPRAPEWPE